jgi:2-methylisocitrate lyase-like PEP mutase family enzyme
VQSASVLGELGFRIVIFPGGTARAVSHLLRRYYASLHQHQTTAPFKDEMLDFDQLNALIGTPELLALGQRYDAGAEGA